MIDARALLIGGSILIVCIALFWMWISARNRKRRLARETEETQSY